MQDILGCLILVITDEWTFCLFFPNCNLIASAIAAVFVIQNPFSALLWVNSAELTGSFYEQAIVF